MSPRPLKIEDLYGLKNLADVQFHPDGDRLAYVVAETDPEANDYHSAVWVTWLSTGEARKFTQGTKRDTFPRWSPDGRWLAFLSDRGGDKPQVWVMPADGGEPRQLTRLRRGVIEFAWAPDSRRLALVSRGDDPDPESDVRVITTVKYKFDGVGFLEGRTHIWTVDLAGHVAQVTDGDWDDSRPAWSPDGRQIAFASNRSAERDFTLQTDIFVVPAEGGEARQLTPGNGDADAPSWSPDGRLIAYVGHDRGRLTGANNRLWVVPAAGGPPRNLTPDWDPAIGVFIMGSLPGPIQPHAPIWTPDGRGLVITAADRGNTHIFKVDLAGNITRLVGGERTCLYASLSPDGARLAFIAGDNLNPRELFLLEDGEERQLTRLNADFLAEISLVRPERFVYAGADGLEIEGWVMKPLGFGAGKRYPLLLHVHGGPHAAYGNNFMFDFQLEAASGYVVLYTNPRASQSYGEAFATMNIGDWGGKDFEDLMRGVDFILAQGYVDPDRLGITGASYGGFMTNWAVGHTDRFRAAVTENSLSNLLSFYGTSDIGTWFSEAELGADPFDRPDIYLGRSPISYVKNIKTPLLIIHAEADHRCPIEQGEQLFVALKRLGKEAVFVRFPAESHGMRSAGKPRHRTERLRHILGWFNKYLQPAG